MVVEITLHIRNLRADLTPRYSTHVTETAPSLRPDSLVGSALKIGLT